MSGSSSVFEAILGTDPADRVFLLGERPHTYGALLSAVESIGTVLRELGVRPGDRVAICFDQGLEYVASLLAVRRAGAVVVLASPEWTDDEKAWVLEDAEARVVLADAPTVARLPVRGTQGIEGLSAYAVELELEPSTGAEPGDAVLLYTSGTTGRPKGVVLTDRGVSANVEAVIEYLGLTAEDASPIFTPPCYAYSLSQNLTHLRAGAKILPVPTGLMFPAEVMQAVARWRLTGISATPTAFRILTQVETPPDLDLSSVRYLMSGGQPLDQSLVGQMLSTFPRAKVVSMYGCSENSPRIAYYWIEDPLRPLPAGYYPVGRAVRGTELRVVSASGGDAGTGEVGEVILRGTSLMRAYWKNPEETARRFRDGWFSTGDLGFLDADGLLYLTGRASTIINVGNEKVSPEEVERVLLEMEGVEDAAVCGVPDRLLGESVCAAVVLRPGSQLQPLDIQRHCRARLSGYKIPRKILFAEAIPRTLYGKIDRAKLRAAILNQENER